MSAEHYDLYIARGGTLAVEIEYADTDDVLVPFPAGWSGKAEVRPAAGDALLLLELTVTLTDPGIIVLSATDEQTAAIPAAPSRGKWDLFLTDPDGNRWPTLAGDAFIRGQVTLP